MLDFGAKVQSTNSSSNSQTNNVNSSSNNQINFSFGDGAYQKSGITNDNENKNTASVRQTAEQAQKDEITASVGVGVGGDGSGGMVSKGDANSRGGADGDAFTDEESSSVNDAIKSDSNMMIFGGIGIVLIGGLFFLFKKKKKKKAN